MFSWPHTMAIRLFLLSALVLLAACYRADSDSYFPIEPGMAWSYSLNVTTMDGSQIKKHLVQAAAPREWNGQSLPVRRTVDGTWLFYQETDMGLYLAGHQAPGQPTPVALAERRQPVLHYPLETGTKWSVETETIALFRTGPPQRTEYRITAPVLVHYEVESVNDTVTVPAGRFYNCLRVRGTGVRRQYDAGNYIGRTDISIDKTDWYAPGVGLVKSVRKESTTNRVLNHGEHQIFAGRVEMELESFRH